MIFLAYGGSNYTSRHSVVKMNNSDTVHTQSLNPTPAQQNNTCVRSRYRYTLRGPASFYIGITQAPPPSKKKRNTLTHACTHTHTHTHTLTHLSLIHI